uniref:ParB/RepB/Spo0J family partition protein n=1 Tax=Cupriavidus ulmosensis TaxID=3065913 RepID=UPI003F867092
MGSLFSENPTMSNFTVPLRKIRHRVNPRTHRNEAKFMELRASVKVHGVIQPILVRPIEPDGEYPPWQTS